VLGLILVGVKLESDGGAEGSGFGGSGLDVGPSVGLFWSFGFSDTHLLFWPFCVDGFNESVFLVF